jgi:alpha-galactosidase
MFSALLTLALAAACSHAASVPKVDARQNIALSIPFYGTSANGFTAPPRGWNSFGLQALGNGQAFQLNQANVQTQCDQLNATAGYTMCSIDSGWSGNGGDPYGRLVPDTTSFPDLTALAVHLHSLGKQLGVYILPGAFSSDANVIVQGTNIALGTLFDTTQPGYNLRQTFDYSKDGVQQWHNSVVNNFAAMYVPPLSRIHPFFVVGMRGLCIPQRIF